jgi:predicted DNA-binding protein with PD1-like motif
MQAKVFRVCVQKLEVIKGKLGRLAMLNGQIGNIHFSRLLEGEDLVESVRKTAEDSSVRAGVFILIGALKNAVLGFYKEGEYKIIRLDGPLEIASCMGNIAIDEKGELLIHAHAVVSNEKGDTFGGHLMKGCHVGPTAELVVIEAIGVNLQRTFDERTKLRLLKLG